MKESSQIALLSDGIKDARQFGERAYTLSCAADIGAPVPTAYCLSFEWVKNWSINTDLSAFEALCGPGDLIVLRSSPEESNWANESAVLNIGVHAKSLPILTEKYGRNTAWLLYRRAIKYMAAFLADIDPQDFDDEAKSLGFDKAADDLSDEQQQQIVDLYKSIYEEELGEEFPQDTIYQLRLAIGKMIKNWNAVSTKFLRLSQGAPENAGLGLIVQKMPVALAQGQSGIGQVQSVDADTGQPCLNGIFAFQTQTLTTEILAKKEAYSYKNLDASVIDPLSALLDQLDMRFADAHNIVFSLEMGALYLVEIRSAERKGQAGLRILVDLVEKGALEREKALLRVNSSSLASYLHQQVKPQADRVLLAQGGAASPGAASGTIVFTAKAAQAAAARDEDAILLRPETSPDDIRGMQSAVAVVTERGGMTSHAAVIARGLGLPCVVGVMGLRLDVQKKIAHLPNGMRLQEGDIITVDGSTGEILQGTAEMVNARLDGPFKTVMEWANGIRGMKVRANADTPEDARAAQRFNAEGIGLCRTEHMFFAEDRIKVMRRMILCEDEVERKEALEELLPMQKADFKEIFHIMAGLPVTIRLLDPPLHEFLPYGDTEAIAELATFLGLDEATLKLRIDELHEFNPMLGKRGVRVGVTVPEIYEMQASAIFEAALEVNADAAEAVVPEIMIPLVSANREVELIKSRIEKVVERLEAEFNQKLVYKLGVMVETPRAALRAGDLANSCSFLSFGTNDLTQMTYGLSRDDAGQFMRDYVDYGVFKEDPFRTLDIEGVGELLLIAAERARKAQPNVLLGICGEHGGDPATIRFCRLANLNYVSCSPFRVPIAIVAAAQSELLLRKESDSSHVAVQDKNVS